MTERAKLSLRIVIFIIASLGFGVLLLYILFHRPPAITPEPDLLPPGDTSGTEQPPPVALPGSSGNETEPSAVANGGAVFVTQLTASSVVSPTLVSGRDVAYYDPADGAFYQIDRNGNINALSEARFPAAQTVTFSPDAHAAALEFPDGNNIVYNIERGTQATFPTHWSEFVFANDGTHLASKNLGLDSTNRSLIITSTDGSQATSIANLGNNANEVKISWSPNDDVVAFSETGSAQSAFGRQEIYVIDRNGTAIGTLIVEGSTFSATWSPSGDHILYSVAQTSLNDRPSLWYVEGTGNNIGGSRKNLAVQTWVEKCTFMDDVYLLCAVPREVPDNGGFDHRLVTAPDALVKINVTNGRKELLAIPAINMQMFHLSVSADGSLLYFTDGQNRLNSIQLR